MPASGDQHAFHGGPVTSNPFEDVKPRISEYTAQEIATLQSRLEKQLGPEYISSRPGPGGQKVHYIAGEKCIQLANEVFGFNGWSSSIMQIQVDYVDEDPVTRKISLGLSVIVRVTLRDGTYHEDIGYGEMENCKGKGAAFHKAKKEATTDALKRALRNFGNVLGNCIYDKAYLTKVMRVKVAPPKWDVDALHRHSDHARIKKEIDILNMEIDTKEVETSGLKKTKLDEPSTENITEALTAGVLLDDDFDDFDEADFGDNNGPDSHPDEVLLPNSVHSNNLHASISMKTSLAVGGPKFSDQDHRLQGTIGHAQPMSAPNGPVNASRNGCYNVGNSGPLPPQQPNNANYAHTTLAKPSTGVTAGAQMRSPQELLKTPRPMQPVPPGHGRVLNQPSRTGQASAPYSPANQQKPLPVTGDESGESQRLPAQVESGFFSARAATLLPEIRDTDGPFPLLPGTLPAFNPHAESPSIRKTPGINHNQTMPLTKDLKHVPGSAQNGTATASGPIRTNIVNPQLDAARKIGAPGSPSPMSNRNMYKPPTMKRPYQGQDPVRPPLADLPANGVFPVADGGGDIKRMRVNGT